MEVKITIGDKTIAGNLTIPDNATGIVLFAHGSGSSRFSPRNNFVAEVLQKAGLATLLMDLLTAEEEEIDNVTAELRFNIPMLAERVVGTAEWLLKQKETNLKIGTFGASTGAAAALIAAAKLPEIAAVVSRGGRVDMAGKFIPKVKAPTLMIVGGNDSQVIGMNKSAQQKMKCENKLEIIPGASHLFEEPGTLEKVAELAKDWFVKYLK